MSLEIKKLNINSVSLKTIVESNDPGDEIILVTNDNKAFKIKKGSLILYTAIPINNLQKIAN